MKQSTNQPFSTPILFLVFNRPDFTQQIFDHIRNMRPTKLFIAADGPRPTHPTDVEKCIQVRKIVSYIDWPCEVKTLFQETNLGCGLAPATAINWFFTQIEEGIILEDDCLPNQSFFLFCEKLLKHYKNDSRIFHIGGTSYFHFIPQQNMCDFHFNTIPAIWGWATWRRAWQNYDFNMKTFPIFEQQQAINNIFTDPATRKNWLDQFTWCYDQLNKPTAPSFWDYQWTYTILVNHGLCIMPTYNLINNIGFREDATHTKTAIPFMCNIPVHEITITNLQPPDLPIPNIQLQEWQMKYIFAKPPEPSWLQKKHGKQRDFLKNVSKPHQTLSLNKRK
jgi:hypothetical protein